MNQYIPVIMSGNNAIAPEGDVRGAQATLSPNLDAATPAPNSCLVFANLKHAVPPFPDQVSTCEQQALPHPLEPVHLQVCRL
jgi:hypothetical protein